MNVTRRGFGALVGMAGASALVLGSKDAEAQGRGGSIVFVNRRPPREFRGDIRGWANSNRAANYNEDTQSHMWRVNFMAFLPRPINEREVTLAWFHAAGRDRQYVSNEPIALAGNGERVFFHTTTLRRTPGEFEPMEHYEAVLSVNTARGSQELARGRLQLIGQVERRSGVVDFTGSAPTIR